MKDRKRLNLSLSYSEYDVLLSYAKSVDTTPTKLVHSLIKDVLPSLEKLTSIVDQAKEDTNAAVGELQSLSLQKISDLSSIATSIKNDGSE